MVIPQEKKIQLTKQGDTLIIPRDQKDENTLPGAPHEVGTHEVCDGYIGLIPTSHTHSVLLCWVCYLRIAVPNTVITTYAQLRAFLQKELQAPP
jgi:hypothetical protein